MATITAETNRDLIALTIGLFDAAPGELYLNEFTVAYNAGMNLSQIANALTTTAAFKTVYPALDTAQDFAARLIANLLGSETGEAERVWATDWIIGQVNANVSQGDIILAAIQALRATTVPDYANAKLALENKIAVAEHFSITKRLSNPDLPDLQAVIVDVTSSATTVSAAKAQMDSMVGSPLFLETTASGTYSATGMYSLEHGIIAGDVEFTGVMWGIGLTITASPTRNTTYTLRNSSGANDFLPLTLTGTVAITTGVITAAGIETVAIKSNDSNATLENIIHTATLSTNTIKGITITGDAGLTLVATSTALTTLDATGITNIKAAVSFTTGALAAAAILTGGIGSDTFIATAATKAVILNGGYGNDTLTVNNANDNTVNGGAGNDTIVVGTGSNKVSGGDGDDTITVGASAGLTTIDVGAGIDTVVLGAPPSVAGLYTSVTGMTAGDKLDFSALTANASPDAALGTRITLGGAAAFSSYLAAATSGDADAAAIIKWFQLSGNTYVVVDNGSGADTTIFEDGVDSVIELVGLIDLSAATVSSDIVTLV